MKSYHKLNAWLEHLTLPDSHSQTLETTFCNYLANNNHCAHVATWNPRKLFCMACTVFTNKHANNHRNLLAKLCHTPSVPRSIHLTCNIE